MRAIARKARSYNNVSIMELNFHDLRTIFEMAGQSRVQRTRSWNMCEQVLHLISKYAATLEINVLGVIRRKWNGNQLHRRLLRRPTAFVVVAATASCRDVRPGVEAAM